MEQIFVKGDALGVWLEKMESLSAVLCLYLHFLCPPCLAVDLTVSTMVPTQRFMDCWIIKPLKLLMDCLAAAKRTEDVTGAE